VFLLRKTHEKALQELHDHYREVIRGYLGQIDLQHERIQDLRSLVFSPTRADSIPPVLEEADKIITQNEGDFPAMEDDQLSQAELRERDLIFSGAYDEVAQ
jgi:hypothetical protein